MGKRSVRLLGAVLAVGAILGPFGSTPATAGDYRTISASLRHETTLWRQVRNADGYPVGCGPTAWTIVLGYWKEHRGKAGLLRGVDMPHPNTDAAVAAVMQEIARDLGTTYGSYQDNKYGRTMPNQMDEIHKYVERYGYSCSVVRERGTEFDKFRAVKAALEQDRPVVILINDPARALSSLHYPVIEKAELKQKKVLGKWRDRDVRYYVNFGNGTRKWIWVREVGRNDHPHTGSFSMFFLDIGPRRSPGT